MKKIAIIEDRYKRQNDFLTQNNIDLEQYEDVLDNYIQNKADDILEQISQNNFSFENYEIIICHKSVKNNTVVLNNLQNYCKKHHKTLVLFSGGISVNYYDNIDYEILELNSKTFYSQNLKLFLDAVKNDEENILMLCYGKKWELNVVSNILEKTNYIIEQVEEDKIFYEEFTNFVDIEKLSKVGHDFYNLRVQNNRITIDEIKQFKSSLLSYYTSFSSDKSQNYQKKNIVIHYDNVIDIEFDYDIKFNSDDDIDIYISSYIINELKNKEFDKIFIKDNLSTNYLELYGLRLAYHIRLSNELGNKRFTPIVIISDFDEATLNRFSNESNILFTDGIHLCKNTKEDIRKYQSYELKSLEDYDEFLSSIEITPPKDTSGSHDIANKWSIYRWAEFLDAQGEAIDKNKSEIENLLYFKYLNALHIKKDTLSIEIKKPTKKGKVLLIDDEWDKGWGDILSTALTKEDLEFKPFITNYKDRNGFNNMTYNKIAKENPDVVILDLRLINSDNENEDIDNYTGIKILQKIHEINAGIQVIMLTATSKSTILEKLYEKKILGYIKKEHPEDKNINTIENINKFVKLVDEGLNRKYLKEIYVIKTRILNILNINMDEDLQQKIELFEKFNIKQKNYFPHLIKLYKEVIYIFDILDSQNQNKYIYAMVSIVSAIESILQIFIKEKQEVYWDDEAYDCKHNALRCRIQKLFQEKFGSSSNFDLKSLIDTRNDYLHSLKNVNVEKTNILAWFKKLDEMIQVIQKPPKLKVYKKGDVNNLFDKFNAK